MHTNALADEQSPYLKQHAHNPVNWLPWGESAFAKARAEDKPIFLSVGYSTCHWCHVMAHESFEDDGIAAVLNRDFVPVKVDREERPDVDRIYMLFVQASTGSGGWPMSVWLTPEREPFFGGTYFPPDSRYGRPGFKEILDHLARAWKHERSRVEKSGRDVVAQLQAINSPAAADSELDDSLFGGPFAQFRRLFDRQWGGFGTAPKFPRPVVYNYLLRYYAATQNQEALDMVVQTLRKMAAGGMHDQLGGGFHRYSVDERWFVPHFEKMLYDQAQLASSYLEAYQITRDEQLAVVARDIFDYVLRDLRDASGGFYSAEDADSADPSQPGHSGEGAFYIWSSADLDRLLDAKTAELFKRRYGVGTDGNVENDPQNEFTGRNILYSAESDEKAAADCGLNVDEARKMLEAARETLFRARETRPRPHLDDKILTSWNALMISALAKGYAVLWNDQYKRAAESALEFLLGKAYDGTSGQLLRRSSDRESGIPGFLDDYAFLAQALLDVFEITWHAPYLEAAIDIADRGLTRFEDERSGGFYATTEDSPDLLLRMKDDYDGAEPTGNSVATDVLFRLAQITAEVRYERRAVSSLLAAGGKMRSQPAAAPQLFVALGRSIAVPSHTILRCETIGPEEMARIEVEWKKFEPNAVRLLLDDNSAKALSTVSPFLAGLERKGRLTIYRCENFACSLPESFD